MKKILLIMVMVAIISSIIALVFAQTAPQRTPVGKPNYPPNPPGQNQLKLCGIDQVLPPGFIGPPIDPCVNAFNKIPKNYLCSSGSTVQLQGCVQLPHDPTVPGGNKCVNPQGLNNVQCICGYDCVGS